LEKILDHNSFIPLYHQLKEILKENIESGFWAPGDVIPSENQLMQDYNISRNTVKKAIENLVQDGLLNRIKGKGTFVSKPKLEQSLSGFYSFSKVMKEKGFNPRDLIISVKEIPATKSTAKHLQLNMDDPVIQLRRVRYAQDEPIIYETSYLPKKLFPGLSKGELENSSLYDLMEDKYGVFVSIAKEIFEPVLIRDYESILLQVEEGYPALLLDRIAYDLNERPIEFCRSIVRGDRCRFYTELL